MSGTIAVDLDGTLAKYDGWKGIEHIGEPITPMVERVRFWCLEGRKVVIFTARVSVPEPERSHVILHIHKWLNWVGLPALDVTNIKDFSVVEIWDDRAIQVEMNTGRRIDGKD
jgi:hypothetical protein